MLAIELIQLKLDAIVTAGTTATRAVKAASVTIPIVMSQDDAPIGNGFVANWRDLKGISLGCLHLNRR